MIIKLVTVAAGIAAVCLVVALGLVAFWAPPAAPSGEPRGGAGLDFSAAMADDLSDLPEPSRYAARDGTPLSYRRYPGGDGRFLVLVHGSGWHGMQFHTMAKALSEAGLATVLVPDLRGHGENPRRRGDVDYIGQLEDDLADLIGMLRDQAGGEAEIVLGGHSSGGGLVVRFAGGRHGGLADAFILMAPFLKHDAPATRPNSGGWARPSVPRIVGLTMLNAVGITALNHLPVITFAMPRDVLDGPLGHTATTAYSFALNTSFAPRSDYEADLRKLKAPFLMLAGADDEAFFADRYEATIAPHAPNGTYVVLPGVGHLGVVSDDRAITAVAEFLKAREPR